MAKIDPIVIRLEDVQIEWGKSLDSFRDALDRAENSLVQFSDALHKAVNTCSVAVKFEWTRYGRLKIKQLCGMRLTRRQRKHIWNVEHRKNNFGVRPVSGA